MIQIIINSRLQKGVANGKKIRENQFGESLKQIQDEQFEACAHIW